MAIDTSQLINGSASAEVYEHFGYKRVNDIARDVYAEHGICYDSNVYNDYNEIYNEDYFSGFSDSGSSKWIHEFNVIDGVSLVNAVMGFDGVIWISPACYESVAMDIDEYIDEDYD